MKYNTLQISLIVAGGIALGILVVRFSPDQEQASVLPQGNPGSHDRSEIRPSISMAPPSSTRNEASDEPLIKAAPETRSKLTDEELAAEEVRLGRFLRIQEKFLNAPPLTIDFEAHSLVTESVVNIMRWHGLADNPTAEQREQGFSLRPEHDEQLTFAAHGQRFRFNKGKFPIYDQVLARRLQIAQGVDPGPFPEEFADDVRVLAEEALRCLTNEPSDRK